VTRIPEQFQHNEDHDLQKNSENVFFHRIIFPFHMWFFFLTAPEVI